MAKCETCQNLIVEDSSIGSIKDAFCLEGHWYGDELEHGDEYGASRGRFPGGAGAGAVEFGQYGGRCTGGRRVGAGGVEIGRAHV